jgi:predicted signal transduction protein with EAL and GGDEF domain
VVFLLGLMQGKTEALDFTDRMVVVKEVVVISQKYKKCSDTKDDKKRLACFDSLTIYMKEREKIYENLIRLEVDSKKESEERLKNIIKNLDKALDLKK